MSTQELATNFGENRLTIVIVQEASEQDTDNAVAAAKAAFPAWSKLTPDQRGQYFKKLASLIRENNDELAALEASSMGRPVGEFFDAYASAAKWDRYAEAGYSVQGKMVECELCSRLLTLTRYHERPDSGICQHDAASTLRCCSWHYSLERSIVVFGQQVGTGSHCWEYCGLEEF